MRLSRQLGITVLLAAGGNACSDRIATAPPVRVTESTPSFAVTAVTTPANWTLRSPRNQIVCPFLRSSPRTDYPNERHGHVMATHGTTGVLMFGGATNCTTQGVLYLADTWRWDGSVWMPVIAPSKLPLVPPAAREGAAMAYDALRNEIVMFGGYNPAIKTQYLNDTWVFRVGGSSWTLVQADGPETTTQPSRRAYAAMAYDPVSARVVLNGGEGPSGTAISNTWEWDGLRRSWRPAGGTRAEDAFTAIRLTRHAMAYDTRSQTMLVFGSQSSPQSFPSTLVGQGGFTGWVARTVTPRPGVGTFFGMSSYAPAGTVVLFGGLDVCFFNCFGPQEETWSWNGTARTWTEVPLGSCGIEFLQDCRPLERAQTAMAYDAGRGNVVMFGGFGHCIAFPGTCDSLGDTYTWGRQVACLPGDGDEITVGSKVECFFKLGTGAQLISWDADGLSPQHERNTTVRFHTKGPGPATIRVRWADAEGEQSTELHFTVVHGSK